LTVTDNNLCSATISVTITEPAALTLAETHVNVLCNGANTGSINVTTNGGGTTPYTFAWSNGAATEDLSSLVAGVYYVDRYRQQSLFGNNFSNHY
jgi:hypothetical protein